MIFKSLLEVGSISVYTTSCEFIDKQIKYRNTLYTRQIRNAIWLAAVGV